MRHGLILLGLLAAAGCNPYQNLGGDFYLGPLDATNFQSGYLGTGFKATGSAGTFSPMLAATVGGNPVFYYVLPATPNAPLIDSADGQSTPLVYVFDGDATADTAKCKPPSKTYSYDPKRDFVRFDRQGNVFEDQANPLASLLPGLSLPLDDTVGTDSTSFTPIYQTVPVTSMGENCNSIHSAEGLVKDANHTVTVQVGTKPLDSTEHALGTPNGKYLALGMVDPRAIIQTPNLLGFNPNVPCGPDAAIGEVCTAPAFGVDDATGLGQTRWGFYNHYLAGYIEGGEVPISLGTMPDPNGGPDIKFIQSSVSTIIAPNTILDSMMTPVQCDVGAPTDPAAPCIGWGFDLMVGFDGNSGARGDAGYSQICKILTYTPADPSMPATDPTQVDKASLDPDSGTFIYCLQVSQ